MTFTFASAVALALLAGQTPVLETSSSAASEVEELDSDMKKLQMVSKMLGGLFGKADIDIEDGEQSARKVEINVRPSDGPEPAAALVVPLAFFTMVMGVIWLTTAARSRREMLRHETIRLAMERGLEIPTELLLPPNAPKSDLRRGLVLTSGGFGLSVMLWKVSDGGGYAIGFLPMFMGLGYLLFFFLERRGLPGRRPGLK